MNNARAVGSREDLFAMIRSANESFNELPKNEREFLQREITPPTIEVDARMYRQG